MLSSADAAAIFSGSVNADRPGAGRTSVQQGYTIDQVETGLSDRLRI
jgi:hypothetical protein